MKRYPAAFWLLALLWLFPAYLSAQNPIRLDTLHRCVFTGKFFGEELHAFSADPGVEAMIQRILDASDRSRNFRTVNTNVVSVAAVVDKQGQYLLYNADFFLEHQLDTALRYALLAHEIGHLVSNHALTVKKRLREESDADRFVGQVMRNLDISLDKTLITVYFPDYSYNFKPEERKKTIRKAWESEDAKLRSGASAGYLNEETLKNLPIPRFPWPPPQCARRSALDNTLFARCQLLQDVDGRLSKALNDANYGQRSYYYVPNGFALVTQFEQYKTDGSPMSEADRWKDYPVAADAEWDERFKRFFTGYTGYFRFFVFIVTDKSFVLDTAHVINAATGKAWLMGGGDRLPPEIGSMPYAANYRVTLLVYEFEAKSSTNVAGKKCPGHLEPGVHLAKSGIKRFLIRC